MMKQIYEQPELEIVEFDSEDILVTSLTDGRDKWEGEEYLIP
jgi:hypothetical protein